MVHTTASNPLNGVVFDRTTVLQPHTQQHGTCVEQPSALWEGRGSTPTYARCDSLEGPRDALEDPKTAFPPGIPSNTKRMGLVSGEVQGYEEKKKQTVLTFESLFPDFNDEVNQLLKEVELDL